MTLLIEAQPLPLTKTASGVIRIARTRVTLDIIVEAFKDGDTAEEIVEQYPTVSLSDVYSVIGYYLREQAKVEAYLQERRKKAEHVRKENEARFNPHGIRERLLARKKS